MREYYGDENFVPLYIEVEGWRASGEALLRERAAEEIQIMLNFGRRYLADEKEFSDENLACLWIKKRYQNNKIEGLYKRRLNNDIEQYK